VPHPEIAYFAMLVWEFIALPIHDLVHTTVLTDRFVDLSFRSPVRCAGSARIADPFAFQAVAGNASEEKWIASLIGTL
jgi:hypothetical protein